MKKCVSCGARNPADAASCTGCGGPFLDLAPRLAGLLFPSEAGRFRDVYFVDEGSFGDVYHCYDMKGRREVAVKVVKDRILKNPRLMELFRRECEFAGSVGEEHLTKTLEFRIGEDRAYTIMEFAEGLTLAEYIETLQVLRLSDFSRIVRQLCAGLHIFHYHDLVHCDLKPGNIVINPDNLRLKIVDFGLAHFRGFENVLDIGMVAGTRGYMSPEQASGSRALGAASDIYSMGVILFELLTGRVPEKTSDREGPKPVSASFVAFEKEVPPAPEVAAQIISGERPALSAGSLGQIAALDSALARCLAREPGGRYKSAADFAEEVSALSKSGVAVVGLGWPSAAEIRNRAAGGNAVIGTEARTLMSRDTSATDLSAGTGVTGVRGTTETPSIVQAPTSATAVAPKEKLRHSLSGRPAPVVTGASQPAASVPGKAAFIFLLLAGLAVISYSYLFSRVVPEPGALKKATGFVAPEPFSGERKPPGPLQKLVKLQEDPAALLEKARSMHSSGKYDEAVKIYDSLLRASPPDKKILNLRGNALNNAGRHEEAVECYDRILSSSSSECWVLHEKSRSLRKLGRADAALKCLDAILAARPSDRFIMHEKASLLSKTGYFSDAARVYDAILAADPSDVVALISMGESRFEEKDFPGSLACFTRALEKLPKDRFLHYRVGYLYQNGGDNNNAIMQYDLALKYGELEKAVASDGFYSDSPDFKNIAGERREARHVYDFRAPADSEIWYLKAVVYGKMGMSEESNRCYEQFMKADRK